MSDLGSILLICKYDRLNDFFFDRKLQLTQNEFIVGSSDLRLKNHAGD